jgi:hypothetical protein
MPTHKIAWCLLLLPLVAAADDSQLLDSGTDTFGKLLNKQAQLLNSEMDLRIRQNLNNGTATIATAANPLPGSKQEVKEGEPTVEAIWGLAGKEVAEISYKGRRVPVSMQEPYISKVDGWKLQSIQQYQIQLVRTDGHSVVQRKTIMLDWMGGQGSQPMTSAAYPASVPGMPITPAITTP